MSSRSRRIRRLGGLVLLFAWAPVATANAVACGVWCEVNGGTSGHHATTTHEGHQHGGPALAPSSGTIADVNCTSPDLLVVAAVAPEAVAVPATSVVAGDPPVAALHSFISAVAGFDTPPPRS